MEKLSGKYQIFKKATAEQIQKWSEELITILKKSVSEEADFVEEYVNQLKRLNPDISNEQLVKKIISRRALKTGGIGAVCCLGGVVLMPFTMPTDLYYTFKIQARMVLAIAYIYGWNIHEEDNLTDLLMVMGGNSAITAVRGAGVKVGQEFTKKAVDNFITRDVMKKINKVISRKIITKAGDKSFTSFTKLVPVIGAPIGGGFNYFGTKAIGKTAQTFYSG